MVIPAHGAAAAAAIAQAMKATGAIVRLEPEEFSKLVNRLETPAVVQGIGGIFSKKYQYLSTYKGLFIFTESKTPVQLPYKTEIIQAKNIWVPGT